MSRAAGNLLEPSACDANFSAAVKRRAGADCARGLSACEVRRTGRALCGFSGNAMNTMWTQAAHARARTHTHARTETTRGASLPTLVVTLVVVTPARWGDHEWS